MGIAVPILGTPRSGTSLTASILHALGVSMGETWLEGDEGWGPDHYWSDAEFARINQKLLGPYDDTILPGQPVPYPEHSVALEELVRAREKKQAWGVKCHLLPLVWPLFHDLCRHEIRLVRTVRCGHDSARSYAARAAIGYEQARRMIDHRHRAVLHALQTFRGPRLEVKLSELVENPEVQVERIARFVGLEPTEEAVRLVRPEWYRFKAEGE